MEHDFFLIAAQVQRLRDVPLEEELESFEEEE